MSLYDDLKKLKKDELIDLIMKYDLYIIQYMDYHGVCQDGCCPVCIWEYLENDYQEKN